MAKSRNLNSLKKVKNSKARIKRIIVSGHASSPEHFTGKKIGKKVRRRRRRNGTSSLTKKQRAAKKHSHRSKYKN